MQVTQPHTPGDPGGRFNPDLDRFARLPEVQKITGRAKTQLYNDKTFPRPVKLGETSRASGWLVREVVAWMADQLTKRDAQSEAA
jgi:predicted DNA-binding transcriptional regulator AlpA